jgi:hypothetical protein
MTSATRPIVPQGADYDRPIASEVRAEVGANRAALDAALQESRWLLFALSAQLLASAVICGLANRPMLVGPLDAYQTFLWAAAVFTTMALAAELFRRRLAEPGGFTTRAAYARAWAGLRRELVTREYLFTVALTFAFAPLCISAFSAAKQAIPALHPFTWDAYLSALGSRLDGGQPMWQRLQPVLGKPEITASLDWFYHRAWTALLMAAFVWTALLRSSHVRRRYLFAFVVMFLVVGNLFALALASAGPAYFDFVASSPRDPYASLLAYLRSVDVHTPLLSVRGEGALWYAYQHRVEAFGLGVSAMPSVHVASAVLTALFGFAFSRILGIALSAVALCTFAASIALGWHYALDGYVGALIACAIWWISGLITRTDPRPAPVSERRFSVS